MWIVRLALRRPYTFVVVSILIVIMGGLAIATALTLVFLPALYVAWFRIKRPDPGAGQNMNIEPLPEIRLEDRMDGVANAAVRELETTAHH